MIRTLFIRKNLKRSKSPLLTRSTLPDIPPEACAPARGFRTTLTSMNKTILFVAGNRHSYLVKLSSVLNNAGFSLYDAVSECVRRYGSADFPAAEVETTVNDIYRRYSASHGSCAFRPDGTSSVPKSAKSAKSATPFPKMAQKDAEYGECDDIELDNTLLPCF